jgi:hypothetical protein
MKNSVRSPFGNSLFQINYDHNTVVITTLTKSAHQASEPKLVTMPGSFHN